MNPTDAPAYDEWFRWSEQVWEQSHQHPEAATQRTKENADRRRGVTSNYKVGDQVWLVMQDLRNTQGSRKLSPCYIGPYQIRRQINEVTYELALPRHSRVHPAFHISRLNPVTPGPLATHSSANTPSPPLVIEGQPAYQVSQILICAARPGFCNIWWNGRDTVLSNVGCHNEIFLTLICFRSLAHSIQNGAWICLLGHLQ